MNYKELSRVIDSYPWVGAYEVYAQDQDAAEQLAIAKYPGKQVEVSESGKGNDKNGNLLYTVKVEDSADDEVLEIRNKLWDWEKVKYPEHWTDEDKANFEVGFEDNDLDDNPEGVALKSDGEYVWLECDEEIED